MSFPRLRVKIIISLLLLSSGQIVCSQIMIKGTVYDRSERFTIKGVSVMGTSGVGTLTDSIGRYSIGLASGDSIFFSYRGKSTRKYPVRDINPELPFDMSLQVTIDTLIPVSATSKSQPEDSSKRQVEYKKPLSAEPASVEGQKSQRKEIGSGLDMDLLLGVKANMRTQSLQDRLEQEEQNNYVDHRFTKALVQKITGLEPPALDNFMRLYRPSYQFIQTFTTDYELYQYIINSSKAFAKSK
jgi:hypothetical protein